MTYRFANAVVSNQTLTFKDAERIEQELATSENAPDENASATQDQTPKTNDASNDVDWKKRHDDLKTFLNKKTEDYKNELIQKANELAEKEKQLNQVQANKTLPRTKEELEAWKSQYPDFYSMLETVILINNDEQATKLKSDIERIEKEQKALAMERGMAELLKIHPDANTIENDPQFAEWFNDQEPEIQQLIKSQDVKKIAKALTIYKRDLGLDSAAVKTSQKDTSKAVSVGKSPVNTPTTKKVWKESEIKSLRGKAFENALPEIELAQREGRVEYDISNNF